MKLSKFALAGAIAGLLSAAHAYAQQGPARSYQFEQTAYEYNSYQDYDEQAGAKERGVEGEPDPQAAPNQETPAADAKSFGNGNGTLLNPCCCLGEQWKIFDSECLKCRNINIAGWLAQSYTWNTSNPADRFNGPVTWTDRSNEYQLNQLYWFAEKATDTKGCGWDFGWRLDFLYGTDNRFTTSSGIETRTEFQNPKWSTFRFYGLAMPQAYLEVAVDDLKVKVGHWYAPVGYEVVPTTGNFFPNLPYTFQYGEPFTMTGVMANYQVNEKTNIGGGITHGWDNSDNTNPHAGAMLTYTEKFQDDAALALAWTLGNEPTQNFGVNGATSFRFLQTAAYSRPLNCINERLTYVAQSDFGYQNNALVNGGDAYWYGLNQYLFYKASDCMTYGIRAEWFRDQEGFRVGGFLGTTPDGSLRGLSGGRYGYPGSFYEITMGANYKYSANTTIRPYARFDWFSGSIDPVTNTLVPTNGGLPFDGGTGNSQTLLGFDVVTLY